LPKFEEDCLSPTDILYVGRESPYFRHFVEYCQKTGIKYEAVQESIWLRNNLIRAQSEDGQQKKSFSPLRSEIWTYLFNKGANKAIPNQLDYISQDRRYIASYAKTITSHITTFLNVQAVIKPVSGYEYLGNHLSAGNVFNAVNQQGVRKVITSEKELCRALNQLYITDEALLKTNYAELIAKPPGPDQEYISKNAIQALKLDDAKLQKLRKYYDTTQFEQNIPQARQLAKRLIEKQLLCNKGNLVVLPSYAYDLDLILSYMGNHTFILHSFSETVKFLQSHRDSLLFQYGTKWFDRILEDHIKLENALESEIVNEIERRLSKHGFQIIKCCGFLANYEFDKYGHALQLGSGVSYDSFLMNGIARYTDETHQQVIYTSLNSNLTAHVTYFSELLSQFGIQWDPIADDSDDQLAILNDYQGGLHCSTQINIEDQSSQAEEALPPPKTYLAQSPFDIQTSSLMGSLDTKSLPRLDKKVAMTI